MKSAASRVRSQEEELRHVWGGVGARREQAAIVGHGVANETIGACREVFAAPRAAKLESASRSGVARGARAAMSSRVMRNIA